MQVTVLLARATVLVAVVHRANGLGHRGDRRRRTGHRVGGNRSRLRRTGHRAGDTGCDSVVLVSVPVVVVVQTT